MTDDVRSPSHPATPRGRRIAVAAAAAAALVLAGGAAVAGAVQGTGTPQLTETTLETTTTDSVVDRTVPTDPAVDSTVTTDDTVDESTTTTVDDEGTEVEDEGTESEHPENHGKVVSEAAHDHSQDDEAGNHGQHVRDVARGDGSTSTTEAPAGAETSSGGRGHR
jgi:hypothetical protein